MDSTRLARRGFAAIAALTGAIAVVVPATSAQADTVVASTASTAPTSPATAPVTAGGCGARTTTQALAQFGDLNDYFPIVGGTFESGDLSPFLVSGGPFIAPENEPWRVMGYEDKRSVALPAGATLRATFCVQIGEDSMRLFAKAPSSSSGSLNIRTTVATAYGSAYTSTTLGPQYAAWGLSPRIPLNNVSGQDGKQYVTLSITNTGTGTWLVDDILVDPWRTR